MNLVDNLNTTLVRLTVISSSSAACVSFVACIVALGALLFFKMYRLFAYRLVFYTLAALAMFSFSNMLFLILVYIGPKSVALDGCLLVLGFVFTSSFSTALLLMTTHTFYLHALAIRNQVYNRWIYDLNCLLISIITPVLSTGVTFSFCDGDIKKLLFFNNLSPMLGCIDKDDETKSTIVVSSTMLAIGTLLILNGVFIMASLIALSYRAYFNPVVTDVRYKQAMKEVLPLVATAVICSIYTTLICVFDQIVPLSKNNQISTRFGHVQLFTGILGAMLGLVAALAFATNLYALGREKRNKLRRPKKRRTRTDTYGSTRRLHQRTTVYTTDQYSDSCITSYPHVSEEDVEREFFSQRNNQQ